jgi:MFS family permease
MSWELFFTYSMLFGISGGIMSQVAFSLLLDCIEDDINFIVALLTGTIGVGYMVFSCLSAYVLFNTDASWQVLFRYYSLGGVVIASLSLIVVCIDTNHKKNITHEEEELSLLALPDRLLSSSNDDATPVCMQKCMVGICYTAVERFKSSLCPISWASQR